MPETTALLEQQWDHIFFTGGPPIGKVVMTAAAKNLTPVVLELGGKNPTIVHESADLRVAARRIAQGPLDECRADLHRARPRLRVQQGEGRVPRRSSRRQWSASTAADPQQSPDYGRIVNARHFDRLTGLLGSGDIYHGGQHDRADLFIAPTILVNVAPSSPVMQEEMFGPILPVLEVDSIEKVIETRQRPALARSASTCSPRTPRSSQRILDATRSGDAAVNDCTVQPLVRELPFGGVGNSGMGKYHGEWGFRAYTNARGVLHHCDPARSRRALSALQRERTPARTAGAAVLMVSYLAPRAGRGRIAPAIRVRGPRREFERQWILSEAQTR